eukprot:TRINITY_DN28083_c0_g1_i1.p2 TRINITY_DN28083_c0_g1~~TRINITY_DN28083_c0_g1_i1.p2  ORF type:complete len:123 (+),score=23.28 TRINITY_DN28083_c0_g1_i1:54-422(+)
MMSVRALSLYLQFCVVMAHLFFFHFFFFLMIRRPPRSTHCISSAASDVYKRQTNTFNRSWQQTLSKSDFQQSKFQEIQVSYHMKQLSFYVTLLYQKQPHSTKFYWKNHESSYVFCVLPCTLR